MFRCPHRLLWTGRLLRAHRTRAGQLRTRRHRHRTPGDGQRVMPMCGVDCLPHRRSTRDGLVAAGRTERLLRRVNPRTCWRWCVARSSGATPGAWAPVNLRLRMGEPSGPRGPRGCACTRGDGARSGCLLRSVRYWPAPRRVRHERSRSEVSAESSSWVGGLQCGELSTGVHVAARAVSGSGCDVPPGETGGRGTCCADPSGHPPGASEHSHGHIARHPAACRV